MTERRTTPDPGAAQDAQVSETYRGVARENAPDHLDRTILDAAAREARPSYFRLRLWTRPAAWAAVVLLSVAIIMQTNQDPVTLDVDSAPAYNPGADPKSAEMQTLKSDPGSADAQQLRVRDEELLERAEEMARTLEGQTEQPAPACDETARATPESWLECIVGLEESGAFDAARVERELLADAFPDFDAP